jgi:uncharacterized protein
VKYLIKLQGMIKMNMLAKNAFIYLGEKDKPALVYDKYNAKLYEIPYDMANAALAQNEQAVQIINQKLAPMPVINPSKNKTTLTHLRLLITNKCNLKCVYCYADEGTYHANNLTNMTTEVAKHAIDMFYSMYKKIKQISFFGGEPLINLDIIEFVCDYISEKFMNAELEEMPMFSMVTNATLLDNHARELILKYSIQLVVSIDGESSIHDLQRPYKDDGGSFDDVHKNMCEFRKHAPFSVEATYTSNHEKHSISRLELTEHFKRQYGINRINITNVSPMNDSVEYLRPLSISSVSTDIIERFFDAEGEDLIYSDILIRLLANYAIDNYIPSFCDAGLSQFSVFVDGDIYPCHIFCGQKNKVLGNVYDGIEFSRLNSMFINKSNEKCADCGNRRFCQFCLVDIERVLNSDNYCDRIATIVDSLLYNIIHLRNTDNDKYLKLYSDMESYREFQKVSNE